LPVDSEEAFLWGVLPVTLVVEELRTTSHRSGRKGERIHIYRIHESIPRLSIR